MLKRASYKSYVRLAILHGTRVWFLNESEMTILRRIVKSMVRVMCGVQLKIIISMELMLGLTDTIDQLAMANSVRWSGKVLRREDGHAFVRALYLEVEGQRKKGRLKRTWKKQVEEESVRVVWEGKTPLADQSGLLVLISLPMSWGETGHPHLLETLPDFKHWCFYLMIEYWHCIFFAKYYCIL